MNCHQILTGACNAGDHCFAVGSVEGIPFTAYAAGCNIVILASTFQRVQIIPGVCHNNIQISCIDCSTDTGKIAAAYENQICIFEPTPLIHHDSAHHLDYRWVQTGMVQADCFINALSWNLEGTRLLTGGDALQLWHCKLPLSQVASVADLPDGVRFEVGEDTAQTTAEEDKGWECIWKCHTAAPVVYLAFSPDGTLFATAGKSDRLVKIWYENKYLLFPSKPLEHAVSFNQSTYNEVSYGFVYITHPRAVNGLCWRTTSKYMPKGAVSNMLVTSCKDNICRIWVETVLPDDGLVNMQQYDPHAAQNPKFRTHRHKHRFIQRLKHVKTCFHLRRHAKNVSQTGPNWMASPIPSLPSTYSVHDFHSYGFHSTGITPGLHFHLAASINAETDIPLVPSMAAGDPDREPCFVLHWLDNKEMHFTLQAEQIIQEIGKKALEKEEGMHQEGPLSSGVEETVQKKKKGSSRMQRGQSQDENIEEISSHHVSSQQSLSSNTTSTNSLNADAGGAAPLCDALDHKIEVLLRDWHHSPDLLVSIHPVDGSFLVWSVEWLDEFYPGSFRQAQVSFSARIPNALPLGDAMTMSTNLAIYNTCHLLADLKQVLRTEIDRGGIADASKATDKGDDGKIPEEDEKDESSSEEAQSYSKNVPETPPENGAEMGESAWRAEPSPVISMISKHSNGTLNLWHITFNEKSKFSHILSISHASRASGHRFRVNDITCHPVLPLLLTTSHHNIPEIATPASDVSKLGEEGMTPLIKVKDIKQNGFCSELILWRVDPVGPLSKSGGVSELARINSPEISAFSNVAWIPTLLPSTTLGNLSNSPSACFVASDGHSLRVYQAVIDARTLLAEISTAERKSKMMDSMISLSSVSSMEEGFKHPSFNSRIHIVSQQSTARPGCIIQLDAISDATHDWQNTQFLHVFQEQLITGEKIKGVAAEVNPSNGLGLFETKLGAIVDLHQTAVFEEPFYIVVLEKDGPRTIVHMWRLVIASQPNMQDLTSSMMYVPDSNLVQDGGGSTRSNSPELDPLPPMQASHVAITTTKVCTQQLPLPDKVEVVHTAPAAGHLSSASIYPACFAPYVVVTACSDSTVRFWRCIVGDTEGEGKKGRAYKWTEWEMIRKGGTSLLDIPGQPMNVSAAYNGRIACAYKYGQSFTRPTSEDPSARYVNLCVAIYECESTGGSEWVREDIIHLKNIHLPQIRLDNDLDLSFLYEHSFMIKKQQLAKTFSHEDVNLTKDGEQVLQGLLAVPSFSTLQSLKRSITEQGNVCPLTQKHLVQLDWVSTEDGSHILTVGVGHKILLFTPVSSDIAQANMKAMRESQITTNRPMLRKASSLAVQPVIDEIRWMKLRKIELETADGLPPLPMQVSWVRDGIFVVGMDSEMHVYSQWKSPGFGLSTPDRGIGEDMEEMVSSRVLRDEDIRNMVHESTQRRLRNVSSMSHLSYGSSLNLLIADGKKKKASNDNVETKSNKDYMPDFGLFEASRIACPVLPQYHPKQLMELLNSGRIRWVKAILAHLVRCITSASTLQTQSSFNRASENEEEDTTRSKGWARSRTLSVSYGGPVPSSPLEQRGSTMVMPEELTLGYAEISSIPPLPLWLLLVADKESTVMAPQSTESKQDYTDLFNPEARGEQEDSLDDLLEEEFGSPRLRERRRSTDGRQSLAYFGPRQARLLSRLLTHTHLPGLTSLDQMHLLALADTVATCNMDFAERSAVDAAKRAMAKENLTGTPQDGQSASTDTLDDCGLRFLMAMKHYTYLLRCLPFSQRGQLQKQGIATSNLVWAFHSENDEELLGLIPSYVKGNVRWSELKELGVGWWLRSNTVLKKCIEKLAKAAYQAKQDPLDAALFYLATKKKSLVWGLFRSKRDDVMTRFFANNFAEERWRKAALKNAFALLGKQRFEHAAAFFLLAGALKDAIEVCLNKLDDFQLAMVIARLYEGDLDPTPPSLQRLLYEEVLGCNSEGKDQDMSKAHPDPFIRSMALWMMKDYSGSLGTLLQSDVGQLHPKYCDEDKPELTSAHPGVFNFYIYLRTHPLIIRQYISSVVEEKKNAPALMLAGFSYGTEPKNSLLDNQIVFEDSITPLERRLYFTTAHAHFKAGCPALSLEVLSKLPNRVYETVNGEEPPALLNSPTKTAKVDVRIDTGTLAESVTHTSNSMDWGASVMHNNIDDQLELKWEDDKEDEEEVEEPPKRKELPKQNTTDSELDDSKSTVTKIDIMAQQLKFIACLKIMMEELSTLATGFEVDGGQLRYQLYIWLEREVEALRELCNYGTSDDSGDSDSAEVAMEQAAEFQMGTSSKFTDKPTLHEVLLAEKMDFENKVQRAAKRKNWLKDNQTLLRTLFSYCSLHGANGGGLASVRMELILLLQELQQDKTQQQLLSPLPFPTTLPLLSASVACNKTVVADPVKHLQSLTYDMLQTIADHRSPPMPYHMNFMEVFVLRDLAIALSACIYQSLCDSDSFRVKQQQEGCPVSGLESLAKLCVAFPNSSHLMAGHIRRRRFSSDEPVNVTTPPSKWPGVTNLRALLAREKDEDTPKLNILLCEAFFAVYMSLLVYGLATCDSHILYRLAGQNFSEKSWSMLFGGGVKKLLKVASTNTALQSQPSVEKEAAESVEQGMWNAVTNLTKQRMRFNMKILGQFGSQAGPPSIKEDRPTYREQFVPPEMSMVAYFMSKPQLSPEYFEIDYDSSESSQDEDDVMGDDDIFDDIGSKSPTETDEHANPSSFAWCLMRLAVVRLSKSHLEKFVGIAGLELQELPVSSPLMHVVLRICNHWLESLSKHMDCLGPPPTGFLPGYFVENVTSGPSIHKYRCLLDIHNTPFVTQQHSAQPVKRLWNYLVRQEEVQDLFIRYIFSKKRAGPAYDVGSVTNETASEDAGDGAPEVPTPVRIIHKEQDSISAFCLNTVNSGSLCLATPKEVQELDISLLLNTPSWMENECEFDILTLNRDPETLPTSNYLVIQTPTDHPVLTQSAGGTRGSPAAGTPTQSSGGQTGRGATVMKGLNFPGSHNPDFCRFVIERSRHLLQPVRKHRVESVRRLTAHPLLPVYLSGAQDGSVQMWEWSHARPVASPRPAGTFARVNRVRFSQQGNKFGVADGDGNLSLWQVGLGSNPSRPYFTHQCHSKQTSDFVFVGCSSLVATAGHGAESKNVALWDTLLPQRKALVTSFMCHEQGCPGLLFAQQHQLIVSGGKKGEVCLWDVRQRQLRHRFQAHDGAIRCLALDPHEEFFVTGSVDGDIKVWGLATHSMFHSFHGEHARSSFFKNIGQGVTQLHVDSANRLFSCGADGSMKVRPLPERERVVHTAY